MSQKDEEESKTKHTHTPSSVSSVRGEVPLLLKGRGGESGVGRRKSSMAKTRSRPYKVAEGKSTRGLILDSWAKAIGLIKRKVTGVGLSL